MTDNTVRKVVFIYTKNYLITTTNPRVEIVCYNGVGDKELGDMLLKSINVYLSKGWNADDKKDFLEFYCSIFYCYYSV